MGFVFSSVWIRCVDLMSCVICVVLELKVMLVVLYLDFWCLVFRFSLKWFLVRVVILVVF